MYNLIVVIVPNNFHNSNPRAIFSHVLSQEKAMQNDEDVEDPDETTFPEVQANEPLPLLQYFEVLPPGDQRYQYNIDHAAGNEHNVPAIFFTDNQNVQWYRSTNGRLKRKRYIRAATKLAIILKHV